MKNEEVYDNLFRQLNDIITDALRSGGDPSKILEVLEALSGEVAGEVPEE